MTPSNGRGSRSPASDAAAPASRARCSTGAAAALVGAQVDVAARQGQAVGLAHGRAADHVDRERQVRDHAPDDGELLVVLLAEVGPARRRRC